MAIHIVWTADPKQAEQAAGQLARKITVIQEKHRALTGEAQKSSQAYQRGMKANFKSSEEARRGLGAMEEDLHRAQAEYVKAQKKQAAAAARAKQSDRARAESAKKTAAAQQKAAVGVAAIRDKLAKKRAATEATFAAARQKHAKKQQAEEARLLATRKRLYEETRTPQERYAAKMRELNALVRKGVIDQQTYRRAAKQAANATVSGAGRGSAAVAGLTASFTGLLTGALSVTTAISGIKQVLSEVDNKANEIAERQRQAAMGLGSLAQLAETPEDFKKLTDRARAIYAAGGAESVDQAARLVFSLESAGASKYEDVFTELKKTGLVEAPDVMAKAAKTLQTSMGEAETGTFRDLLSKAFGASKFSPALAEDLLKASARSGVSAGGMGISDEEVMAATSIVSAAKGSAEEGGTYLAQMFRTLKTKPEFGGMDLREIVADISARQMPAEDAKKWWGRAQGQEAFAILEKNLPTYQEALTEVRRSEAKDTVGKKLAFAGTDPELAAALEQKRAKAKEELSRATIGVGRNISEAAINDMRIAMREGRAPVGQAAGWGAAKGAILGPEVAIEAMTKLEQALRMALGDERYLRLRSPLIRQVGDEGTQTQLNDHLERLREATVDQTERIENAIREQGQALEPETRVIEAPALVEAL